MSDDMTNKLKLTKEQVRSLEFYTDMTGIEAVKFFVKIAMTEGIPREKIRRCIEIFCKKNPAPKGFI